METIKEKISTTIKNAIAFCITIFVGMSIIGSFNNHKRGMLGNLIGGFVVILVGASLMGPIAQEINNAADCMDSNLSIALASGSPEGSTDSFGGAGSNHFGGYDGKVKHNTFIDAVASTSVVKTNKSILNPDCTPMAEGSWGRTIVQIVPGFFALAILGMAIAMIYASLRNTGMI